LPAEWLTLGVLAAEGTPVSAAFRVGVTRDFLKPDGRPAFPDIGTQLLTDQAGVEWEFLPRFAAEIPPEAAAAYDGLLVLAPRVTAATLQGHPRLAVIARFGVGYDSVDVEACTRADVALTITPDAVRRPVAASALTFLLALAHKLPLKDRLTREGRWSEKMQHMGLGLTGRTLGLVGLGNIGQEICRLVAPLDMKLIASDPFGSPAAAASVGAELVELETLLAAADFVCVCCALTAETRHLLDERRLALLQPSAFLINVARGPIVDQSALTRLLTERRIQGAALDVFEQEPIANDDPLLKLDNVIVAPHAICWTDELFRNNGRSACQSLLDIAAGREPRYLVNRDVLQRTGFQQKLKRNTANVG
jgi:phosphoglycerate dehydrogenase-like enzyme